MQRKNICLAKNWRENGNLQSAHKLVTSHLRLVAKIAMGYTEGMVYLLMN